MKVTVTTVIENIRAIREARGLSQSELAEKLGWKRQAVNRLEDIRSDHNPNLKTLMKIAGALEVKLSEIFQHQDIRNWDLEDKLIAIMSLPEDRRQKFERILELTIEGNELYQKKNVELEEARRTELNRLSEKSKQSRQK